MSLRNKKQLGFTLLELLVVIAIIGIFSSIVLFVLNDARAKGRDARRLSDVKQLMNALELYRTDAGSYPIGYASASSTRESSCGDVGDNGKPDAIWSTALSQLVTQKYISALPKDPINNGVYCYRYQSGGSSNRYQSCKEASSNIIAASTTDYAYFIYLSLEKPPSNRYDIYWDGFDNAYVNTCILGPKIK
jgi:prepilin-type N-terminal cleavage/methylation domain-containing protein